MKKLLYFSTFALVVFMFSTGFQCGSPELTSARLYIQQKNFDKAIEALEKEVRNNPKSVEGWYLLGQLKADKKDIPGMLDAFKKCVEVDPVTHKKDCADRTKFTWIQSYNSGVANFNKGRKDNNQEGYEASINDFKDAIMIYPDSISTYWSLAAAYKGLNKIEDANATYKFIAEKKNDVMAYLSVGDSYLEKGNKLNVQFVEKNKDKIELQAKFEGIINKISQDAVRKSLGEPSDIIKPTPVKDKKSSKKPPTDLKEEWVYKNYNLHIYFDKGLVLDKKFDPANQIVIDSSDRFKAVTEWNQAIIWYNKASEIATDSLKLSIMEALTKLYISVNRLDEAIRNGEAQVAKEPKNRNALYTLGVLYSSSKNYDKANEEFKKALDVDPNDPVLLYNLFVVYNNWAIKMKDEATSSEDTTYLSVLRQSLPYILKLNSLKPDNIDYIEHLRFFYGVFQMKPELEALLERLKGLETQNASDPSYWNIMFKIYMNLNKQKEATQALDKSEQLRKSK